MTTFLNRYRILLISLILCLVSLHLASTNTMLTGGTAMIKSAIDTAVKPIQTAVQNTQNSVAEAWQDYVYLVGIKGENERLTAEMNLLREENNLLREELGQSARLKELLAFKEKSPLSTEAASILGYGGGSGWTKTLTLNKGSGDGISVDMPLLSAEGIIGRVINVSGSSSTALLLMDPRSSIDVIVQRTRVKGIAQGDGADGLRLKYVTNLDDVQAGDTLVTAGISGVFPKGIMVGEVRAVTMGDDNFFKSIEVKPAAEMKRLEEVLIVTGWQSPLHSAIEEE